MRVSAAILCGAALVPWLPLGGCARPAESLAPATETIVFMRHGEKPPAGLGQISCRGFNRAVALPKVLARQFGTPAAIFAPDPAETVQDKGVDYNYVRPLATVEPTAVALGLPIDTRFGVRDIAQLEEALTAQHFRHSLIFVGWEHRIAVVLARDLMRQNGGDPGAVPEWPGTDFDSLYVVAIRHDGGTTTATFRHAFENLNEQSNTCP